MVSQVVPSTRCDHQATLAYGSQKSDCLRVDLGYFSLFKPNLSSVGVESITNRFSLTRHPRDMYFFIWKQPNGDLFEDSRSD